jgi:hypothetical protein
MVTRSKATQEAMWGDAAILRYLDMARESFEKGERSALLYAVALCARVQAVIPEWATDALLDAQRGLESGEYKDFNDAYGWAGESRATRTRTTRRALIQKDVLNEMWRLRPEGASLSPDDMFDRVQESLAARGIKASRRDIEAIYKERGQFIKDIPKSKDDSRVFAWGDVTLELPRRSGRPTFDSHKK